MKNKRMIGAGEHAVFVEIEKGEKYMIDSGDHAVFVSDSMPSIKEIDKKIDRILTENTYSKIKSKVLTLTKKNK